MYNDIDLLLILSNKDIYYKYNNIISRYITDESNVIVSEMDHWFVADPD